MDSQTPRSRILMFPWLAHGHIFPFLELSKRILTRKNFQIYICTTAINFSSIKNFIQTNNLDHSIELVELHLEPDPQLPPHYHTTKNLPSNLIATLIKAFQTSKSSFSDIITALKPDLVIYDSFQPWAAKLASSQGILAVLFIVLGAASVSYVRNQYSCRDDDFPFPELCLKGYEKEVAKNMIEVLHTNVFEGNKETFAVNCELSYEVILLKTSWSFERKYIEYYSGACGKKLLPVGPLVTDPSSDVENSDILQWLSKKSRHSTVYISFGSEYFLSKEEIQEIAKGLVFSEVNFIWIIRFPLGEKTVIIEETLPEGFLDRTKDRGIVVTGWAPQATILQHPSTGAFISHCGWSSIMESLYFGVPIIGMPMKLIMFVDANMLVEVGACVRVPRMENEGYKGEEIASVIGEVIAGKSGDRLRHKAQELSMKMRIEEPQQINIMAEHLWQICLKNKLKEQDA